MTDAQDGAEVEQPSRWTQFRYDFAIIWIGIAYRIMPEAFYDELDKSEAKRIANKAGLEVIDE